MGKYLIEWCNKMSSNLMQNAIARPVVTTKLLLCYSIQFG